MIAFILLILLIIVIYFYITDTVHYFSNAVRVTARMILVLLTIFLVLGLLVYSFIKT